MTMKRRSEPRRVAKTLVHVRHVVAGAFEEGDERTVASFDHVVQGRVAAYRDRYNPLRGRCLVVWLLAWTNLALAGR
jgi:hypothetical protein